MIVALRGELPDDRTTALDAPSQTLAGATRALVGSVGGRQVGA